MSKVTALQQWPGLSQVVHSWKTMHSVPVEAQYEEACQSKYGLCKVLCPTITTLLGEPGSLAVDFLQNAVVRVRIRLAW